MVFVALAKVLPQGGSCSVEAATNGRRTNAQETARLLRWEAEPLHQHERFALVHRQ